MFEHRRTGTVLTLPLLVLLLSLGAPAALAGHDDEDEEDDELPFAEATLFFELNDTDGDLGIHGLIDGGPWRQLSIANPREQVVLRVTARGTLGRHGMTEIFFESAEPPFDELAPAAFFRRFPKGTWEVEGTTLDGRELESEATVRHVLPAPPKEITLNGQPAAENCDADPLPVLSEPVVIDWEPVTTSHPEIGEPGPIEVVRYELIVEREEPTLLVLEVDLPPGVTEFELPEDFTGLGDELKFEILVEEASGNRTAVESCFEIR